MYVVPKFIEEESKIVGPLTLQQLFFVLIAAIICIILFNILPFQLFLIISFILVFASASLCFLKVGGLPLPSMITHFLSFFSSSKIYMWEKKNVSPKIIKKKIKQEKKQIAPELTPTLNISSKSLIKKLSNQMK